MFFGYILTKIPFDLNFDLNSSYHYLAYMFFGCNNITQVPKINNVKVYDTSNMFCGCNKLRTIPEDIANTWDWGNLESQTEPYDGD